MNYPEVVQDNTESPEDETALTEVFDKASADNMYKEQRSRSLLPQVSFVKYRSADLCILSWKILLLSHHNFTT